MISYARRTKLKRLHFVFRMNRTRSFPHPTPPNIHLKPKIQPRSPPTIAFGVQYVTRLLRGLSSGLLLGGGRTQPKAVTCGGSRVPEIQKCLLQAPEKVS